jgi:hypothetical protein
MKKQIVKIGDKFSARYKKWYYFNGVYISRSDNTFYIDEYIKAFCLCETEKEAVDRMEKHFYEPTTTEVEVIRLIK